MWRKSQIHAQIPIYNVEATPTQSWTRHHVRLSNTATLPYELSDASSVMFRSVRLTLAAIQAWARLQLSVTAMLVKLLYNKFIR